MRENPFISLAVTATAGSLVGYLPGGLCELRILFFKVPLPLLRNVHSCPRKIPTAFTFSEILVYLKVDVQSISYQKSPRCWEETGRMVGWRLAWGTVTKSQGTISICTGRDFYWRHFHSCPLTPHDSENQASLMSGTQGGRFPFSHPHTGGGAPARTAVCRLQWTPACGLPFRECHQPIALAGTAWEVRPNPWSLGDLFLGGAGLGGEFEIRL